jgi:FKBP-type peptidyl-prolyl cis-trans isomerase
MLKIGLLIPILALVFTACTHTKTPAGQPQAGSTNQLPENTMSDDQALVIETLIEGTGSVATPGAKIKVHYTGTLTDGTTFDSSYDRGEPIEFVLGSGQVIPGWEQGIEGMRVGEKRELTIPPNLAYGDRQVGPIPPNSTLNFEVELVDISQPR